MVRPLLATLRTFLIIQNNSFWSVSIILQVDNFVKICKTILYLILNYKEVENFQLFVLNLTFLHLLKKVISQIGTLSFDV